MVMIIICSNYLDYFRNGIVANYSLHLMLYSRGRELSESLRASIVLNLDYYHSVFMCCDYGIGRRVCMPYKFSKAVVKSL